LGQLIVLVAMFALLWLFLILPSRRRAQAQRQLIAGVEVGDEILTVGGLIGRVRAAGPDDELVLEIAPETRVRVARRAVASVLTPGHEGRTLEPGRDAQPDEQVRS
jgi:preprotein translocase subunit YajC